MFTGLIEGEGRIISLLPEKGGLIIEVQTSFMLEDTKIGDSIAVNGVCLTAIEVKPKTFKAHISPETLNRTTFKYKKQGDWVNLERALKVGDRLGGHLVSGHIDGIGKVLNINPLGDFYQILIEIPEALAVYLVEKGSIAVDGISLTINKVKENSFELMIIPHTYQVTTLKYLKPGDLVNIEIDMIAKMVHKWLSPYLNQQEKKSQLSLEFLKQHGFL
ncbi:MULTISPECIES: riboflavin synthase [Thermodesulfobacterium]|uniref:Riboflavin synthase n=2 Tax=Thermodesulfobacterium commune TaxID=1741 RepID=A0A075WTF1_9BACT|nr:MULTISPECIES: riboflavin synthase [Thermodesulfobacterium]KUJ97950.1 MAG: Riboflavin synthase, alpha subunit [Thermodesulfobacterium sp. 37_54]KUK19679.1 MAG: Riboflavin synthase, alpha subunit [Thermodesulfobacterium commune]AIH04126.1 riboflavin synthase subunit alpha [Thermodesulfobacterium commune DSM 2178]KUK38223.1 MAG: Riboflavin synthase, alpha subunit [Thermodesulfobacterium commune]MBZ4682283.1 riboflavin synthase subunit alpha [Thermodesulfobacterium sp.]